MRFEVWQKKRATVKGIAGGAIMLEGALITAASIQSDKRNKWTGVAIGALNIAGGAKLLYDATTEYYEAENKMYRTILDYATLSL